MDAFDWFMAVFLANLFLLAWAVLGVVVWRGVCGG